jgi:hypothetical protein
MRLQVRVNLWDLAGSPDYLEVRNEFYKDSQAALLAFDLANRQSFESLSSWMAEAAKYGAPHNMVRPYVDATPCQGFLAALHCSTQLTELLQQCVHYDTCIHSRYTCGGSFYEQRQPIPNAVNHTKLTS